MVRVLNSKACRGAIMFGDVLHQGQVCGVRGGMGEWGRIAASRNTCWSPLVRTPQQDSLYTAFLLTALQCQALLDKLTATQLCFSCAHGRPTTVPVVDQQLLQQALRMQAEAREAAAGSGGSSAAAAATGQKAGLAGLKARLKALVQ